MVILRMFDAFGMRRADAGFEINRLGRFGRANGSGPDPKSRFCNFSPRELRSD
jgi:hypothetical protein